MTALEISMNALIRISHGVDHPQDVANGALRAIAEHPQHLRELRGEPEPVNWHTDHSD